MNTPTDEPYDKFLLRIAQGVDSLLIENPSAITRFRKHLQDFAAKANKHLKWLNKKRKECFRKGNVFSISSDMEVPIEYESPTCMFVMDYATKNLRAPKNKAEEYQRNYITLASIHDHILTQVEPIDKRILPEQSAFLIWKTFHEFWDSSVQRAFIEQAFKRVEADLAKQPAETGRDIAPAREYKEKRTTVGSLNIQTFQGVLGDVQQAENLLIGDNARIHKNSKKPAGTEQEIAPGKRRTIRAWFKTHPHKWVLVCTTLLLVVLCVLSLLIPRLGPWFWGSAVIPLFVLIVSLVVRRSA